MEWWIILSVKLETAISLVEGVLLLFTGVAGQAMATATPGVSLYLVT